MASWLVRRLHCDLCVSISGNAECQLPAESWRVSTCCFCTILSTVTDVSHEPEAPITLGLVS